MLPARRCDAPLHRSTPRVPPPPQLLVFVSVAILPSVMESNWFMLLAFLGTIYRELMFMTQRATPQYPLNAGFNVVLALLNFGMGYLLHKNKQQQELIVGDLYPKASRHLQLRWERPNRPTAPHLCLDVLLCETTRLSGDPRRTWRWPWAAAACTRTCRSCLGRGGTT